MNGLVGMRAVTQEANEILNIHGPHVTRLVGILDWDGGDFMLTHERKDAPDRGRRVGVHDYTVSS